MHDLTILDVERLQPRAEDTDIVLQMDEDAFRAFYDRTARSVWLYLSRLTGDPQTADDLLQEAYFRFLRADRPYASDAHRRNYLFRIATNLARDRHRRRVELMPVPDSGDPGELHTGVDEGACANLDRTRAPWRPFEPGERVRSSPRALARVLASRNCGVARAQDGSEGALFRARRRLATPASGPGHIGERIVNRDECFREPDVVEAVRAGEWPARSRLFASIVESQPSARKCWPWRWRFRWMRTMRYVQYPRRTRLVARRCIRARQEAVQTAERPMTIVECVAAASAVGLASAAIGAGCAVPPRGSVVRADDGLRSLPAP